MTSPLASVNNCRPRWRSSAMVLAWTLWLGSTHSLVKMGSLRTAAALHRSVAQPAARVRSRQRAARVVAGLHTVGESLVLLTRHSCGHRSHARYLLPTYNFIQRQSWHFKSLTAIRSFPPVADCDTHSSAGLRVAAERHAQALLQTGVTVTSSLDASLGM